MKTGKPNETQIGLIFQGTNKLYGGEIRDEFNDVVSAITATTSAEVKRWFWEKGIDDSQIKFEN